MNPAGELERIVMQHDRGAVLQAVAELDLPDAWTAAGFVRNAVWDELHGYRTPTPLNDIDVIYFDRADTSEDTEKELEAGLRSAVPGRRVSVKNQARMHLRNHDEPYTSSGHAMARWSETCTAVGVAMSGTFEVLSPFGLDDLFRLVIRPTRDDPELIRLVRTRAAEKRWTELWPRLRTVGPGSGRGP